MTGTHLDLTERKAAQAALSKANEQLEERVMRRTAELQEANKELDSFAHSISHDLRAPLRAISGFGEFLTGEYASAFDERGRGYLARMMTEASSMSTLIDDLLQFARATRADLKRVPVNLSKLAQEIVFDLQQVEPERSVQFICALDLSVEGDPRLLRVALTNLLGNAWKYTKYAAHLIMRRADGGRGRESEVVGRGGAGLGTLDLVSGQSAALTPAWRVVLRWDAFSFFSTA